MAILQNANAITPASGFELKSARFDNPSAPYLTRTPTVDGNRRTWTYSCWFKPSNKPVTGSETFLWSAYDGSGGYHDYIRFDDFNSGTM